MKRAGETIDFWYGSRYKITSRLSENAHLPFDRLMALSKVDPSTELRVDAELSRSIEGLRYPHPSSLRRTSMYASFLAISEALHMDIFRQPVRKRFSDSLIAVS